VVGREETQRKLDPILGDAPIDARIDLADLQPKPFLESLHFRLADALYNRQNSSILSAMADGFEQTAVDLSKNGPGAVA